MCCVVVEAFKEEERGEGAGWSCRSCADGCYGASRSRIVVVPDSVLFYEEGDDGGDGGVGGF